ncbi:MAG: GAF domain-containing protein, partial [Planctomycetota bacterium]
MSRLQYRRNALLARIHTTLDNFYMRQEIDWDYDTRKLLDQILGLAMKDLEFGEGKPIDRGLIVVQRFSGEQLEKGAGWRDDDEDLVISRTILDETLSTSKPVLVENAQHDPRFENAESIKALEIVSFVCVPILAESLTLGAIYVECRNSGHIFNSEDRAFLVDFAATIAPHIKTALLHQEHVAEIRKLIAERERGASLGNIQGKSKAIEKAIELARIAARIEKSVLITGDSGTGK